MVGLAARRRPEQRHRRSQLRALPDAAYRCEFDRSSDGRAVIMRALQPPFIGLATKLVASEPWSNALRLRTAESNHRKMLFFSVLYFLFGIVDITMTRQRWLGIGFIALTILNVCISYANLARARKSAQ
jgi:hypothetical protein